MSDRLPAGTVLRRVWRAIANGLRLRRRLLVAVGAALASLPAIPFVPAALGFGARSAIAWDVGGLTYLALAFALMSSCDAARIRKRASFEDEARLVFSGLIVLAILSSFYAVFALIADAKALHGLEKTAHIALAALTVVVSWLLMQVVFTLHYAHDYYGAGSDGEIAGGMRFPEDDEPDYWDFFYFTTSIGAASQTSDVAITSKAVRRLVAFQAVLAFAFNTTIVALAINLASGLI